MRLVSISLRNLAFTVAISAIFLELLAPSFTDTIKYHVLVGCLLVIGIPHGSIDHIVTSSIFNLSNTIADQSKFYLYYLIMMSFMTAIWILSPVIGFLIFASLTIYHFGQADLEHLQISYSLKRILFISRGTMIMGLILFSDTTYTYPIITDITGSDFLSNLIITDNYSLILALIPLQYIIIQFLLLSTQNITIKQILSTTIDSIIVIGLFLIVNPILAFSIYFGLWHSAGHVREMLTYFNRIGKKMNLKKFYLKALPLNMITLVGIGIIYWLNSIYQFQLQIVSILFIIISILTLPHMLIVEKMYMESRQVS